MNRFTHLLFGEGVLIEPPRITESGKSVSLIRFDSSTVDRLILTSSLKPSSSAPVDSGEVPKKGKKKATTPVKKSRRKTASPPVEEVSDRLLVEALDDTLAETDPEREETETLEVLTFNTKWTERKSEVITRSD
jgi:hypothetical protein